LSPELPEVESIRRGLEPRVKGRRIERAEARLKKQVRNMPARGFERRLAGQRIVDVGRRGKFLLLRLDRDILVVHLGMTGQLTYWDHSKREDPGFVVLPHTGLQKTATQHPIDKHTHALFYLDGGDRIQYRDIRQFGHLYLFGPGELEKFQPIRRLGIEPLSPAYTWKAFRSAMADKRGALKPMLLSQRPVVGLGNIYADEALFKAKLHPLQKAERVTEKGWKALFAAIPAVLKQGLKFGGTTLMDYRDALGGKGSNQERLKAYGRAGEPCLRCGRRLKKIIVSQRSTVFCPSCQPRH
jgi:formamidopyrimidine-DNA glycosylase